MLSSANFALPCIQCIQGPPGKVHGAFSVSVDKQMDRGSLCKEKQGGPLKMNENTFPNKYICFEGQRLVFTHSVYLQAVRFLSENFEFEAKMLVLYRGSLESKLAVTTPCFSINNFLFLKLTSTNCILVSHRINELHFDVW